MVCVVVRDGKWNNAGKEREGGKILRKRAENAKKKNETPVILLPLAVRTYSEPARRCVLSSHN